MALLLPKVALLLYGLFCTKLVFGVLKSLNVGTRRACLFGRKARRAVRNMRLQKGVVEPYQLQY